MPKYMMRISNGQCFPYETHGHLEGDPRYTVRVEGEEVAAEETVQVETDDRWAAIIKAVYSVPVEQYVRPVGGKLPMPKVGDVSSLAGFKVTADEIKQAMEQTK